MSRLWIVVFAAIYLTLASRYDRVVLGLSNAVTMRLRPPLEIEVRPQGGWDLLVFTPEQGLHPLRAWSPDTAHLIYLSLVALPALLLATPAPLSTRLRLLAIALPVAFLAHVLSVVVLVRGTFSLRETPGAFLWLIAMRAAYMSGQLVAATLWVLLTWRHWFPRDVARRTDSANT